MKNVFCYLIILSFVFGYGIYADEPAKIGINSDGWEHSATISGDGKLLVFAYKHYDNIFSEHGYEKTGPQRPNNNGNNFDLYGSMKQDDGSWSEPVNIGSVNSGYNDYYPNLSANGKVLFFAREKNVSNPKIFYSIHQGGHWTFPQELPNPFNSLFGETSPHQIYDGSALIFASRRPRFSNPWNLWISFKNDKGQYDIPKSLIRNQTNMLQAVVDPFNHYIYFLGENIEEEKQDIFYGIKIESDVWGIPEPIKRDWTVDIIGAPFFDNSGEYMYLTCYKKGETGFMDIYASKREDNNAWGKPIPFEDIK